MSLTYIEKIRLHDKIVCAEQLFSVGWCDELSMFLMEAVTPYIIWYHRYYAVTEEDYLLMKRGLSDEYINKHITDIKFDSGRAYGSAFLGSESYRRDYLISVQPDNPRGYVWLYNALFMTIYYKGNRYAVAPGRSVYDSSGVFEKYEFEDNEKYPEVITLAETDKNGKKYKVLCGITL